jgi:regulator of replication initiation timing
MPKIKIEDKEYEFTVDGLREMRDEIIVLQSQLKEMAENFETLLQENKELKQVIEGLKSSNDTTESLFDDF